MATNFPEELDSFLNPLSTDSVAIVSHAAQHSDANDAIEALQAKLGANNSTDTSSIDYRIKALEDKPFDSEAVRDAVDLALVAGSGIIKVNDDVLDTLTLSIDTSIIQSRVENVTDTEIGYLNGVTSPIQTQISAKLDSSTASLTYAPIASPTFTGTPEAPTAVTGTNTTQIATTAFVKAAADGSVTLSNEYTDEAVAGLGNSLPNIYVPISDVGASDGVAQLVGGFVPLSQLNITEEIQDVASSVITGGTHTNISTSFDNVTKKLSLSTTPLTQDQIQDFVAPLLTHSQHTNITATYDDDNNRIVLSASGGGGGGASVTISPTAPTGPNLGNIWLDSDNGSTFIWDGVYWVEVGGASTAEAIAAVTSTAPSNPSLGRIWLNSTTAKTYIYDGSYWVGI